MSISGAGRAALLPRVRGGSEAWDQGGVAARPYERERIRERHSDRDSLADNQFSRHVSEIHMRTHMEISDLANDDIASGRGDYIFCPCMSHVHFLVFTDCSGQCGVQEL